ncbi:hypothetical protein ABEG18_06520 [Alsobacter sp. KACC 23698]|uniref:Uncharacterized protein n=1 Tax=Alsobacter sp. KACC 23698 TaxID=3149229 RepID=A0AAU7JJP4_9HYPH
MSTLRGHERQVFDVLKAELEQAGSKPISAQQWAAMSLESREEWLELELVNLQARVQAKVDVAD